MTAALRGHQCPHCQSDRLNHQRDEKIANGVARLWLCLACDSTCRSYDYLPGHGTSGTRQLVGRYADQIAMMATALVEAVGNGGREQR